MIRLTAIAVTAIFVNLILASSDSGSCALFTRPKAPDVPKNLTHWSVNYPDYKPVEWKVDCEHAKCDTEKPQSITFNKIENGVDRTRAKSCYRKPPYFLSTTGFPMNPAGRTGFYGRGRLPRWGPNHMVKLLLQRKNGTGYYSFTRFSETGAKLPGFFVDLPSKTWLTEEIRERLKDEMQDLLYSSNEAEKAIKKAESGSKSLLKGSIPSAMNTDNAWIELHLRFVDCNAHRDFCIGLVRIFGGKGYEWIPADYTRDKKSYLHSMDEKFGLTALDHYSAFCKALAVKNSKSRFSAAWATALGLSFPLLIIAVFTSIAAVPTFGLVFLLLPAFAAFLIGMEAGTLIRTVLPSNCS